MAGALDGDGSVDRTSTMATAFPGSADSFYGSGAIERDPGRALLDRSADRAELRRLRRLRREWSRCTRESDPLEWRDSP